MSLTRLSTSVEEETKKFIENLAKSRGMSVSAQTSMQIEMGNLYFDELRRLVRGIMSSHRGTKTPVGIADELSRKRPGIKHEHLASVIAKMVQDGELRRGADGNFTKSDRMPVTWHRVTRRR